MSANNHRLIRIAEQIQSIIGGALQTKVSDPRLDMVTVSAVKVSRDLSHARVYVTFIDVENKKEKLAILNRQASGFLRNILAKEVSFRIVPSLRFVYDDSIERGSKISKLIDDAISGSNEVTTDLDSDEKNN